MKLGKLAMLVLLVSGLFGCADLPYQLRETDAQLLDPCPKTMDITLSDNMGAILTSLVIHTHDRNTWYFLLKEEATRSKYLLKLEPGILGWNGFHKEGAGTLKSPSRPHCYVIQPGRYQFVRAYAYRDIGGRPPQSAYVPRMVSYEYRQEFRVDAGSASYIGQIFVEDPRLKGKGYFGHAAAMLTEIPDAILWKEPILDVEISHNNELDDDVAWLESHTHTRKTSVVNMTDY